MATCAGEDLLDVRLVREMACCLLEHDVVEREAVPEGVHHLELLQQTVRTKERRDLLRREELEALDLGTDGVELELGGGLRHSGRVAAREVLRALEERRVRADELLLGLDLLRSSCQLPATLSRS